VGPGPDNPGSSPGRAERLRAVGGIVVIVAVVTAAGVVIYGDRHSFVATLQREGDWAVLASFACGLIGVAATFPVWREVLGGLGVRMPWGAGARVFFTSQLGKYLPGSVWPVVLQMEAGRARGANRRTMLAANLITIVMSVCVGLIVACLLLPLYDPGALTRYWWTLIALPFLLALLHPRALPAILDRFFGLLHRPPLGEQLDVRSGLRASGWSLVSWIGLGGQVVFLCLGLGRGGWSVLLLCTGGMALAVSLGVLFIPAPAGAGVRDVVLALVLGTILTSGQALAVVVASRVILVACDVSLAAVVAIARHRPGAAFSGAGSGAARADR
jgi:glycosyltransferase 2 family protein